MGQVTIYLDEETERRLEAAIRNSSVSKSRWICDLIKEKTADEWPEQVKKLAGAWKSFPLAEELRRGLGQDDEREPF